MVNFSELKAYKSDSDGLGGAIDTTAPIVTATHRNLFTNIDRAHLVTGDTYYKCMYFKNESAEDMEKFLIWISRGSPLQGTAINFAFDAAANPTDKAVGFDGVDDYIDCTNDAELWSKSLTKFSFAMWIWPQAGWDGNDRVVVSHGGASNLAFRCIIDSSDPGRIRFLIKDSGGVIHTAYSNALKLDEWNHVICSYDSSLVSDNIRIYVNGIKDVSADFTSAINLSAALTLSESSTDYEGYMRDFRFWDDQSINNTEALALFASDDDFDEPAYHLNFGEGTGTTAKDSASNTKTATLTNGVFWKISAMTISDQFEEPPHIEQWYDSGDKPGTFKLKSGKSFPIWLRLEVDADADATPFKDDNGIFSIRFDITAEGTGTPPTPGGGGDTGGNPPPASSDYSIAIAGDWGCSGTTDDVIDLIKQQNYDFVVGVGDNAYAGASCWISRFKSLKDKMESGFGNHEYSESGGITPYKDFFGYSKTYFSFVFQNFLFVVLDDNDFEDGSAPSLDSMTSFARQELEKYKSNTKIVWRAVVTHHPPFGTGGKHPANEGGQVQKWHKLFTDYNVNFWYCGHDHNWQRTHSVSYNSNSPKNPHIVDSSSPYTRLSGGLINIVTGTGGHDSGSGLYALFDDASFWAYRNKSHNGVHELVASNGGLTLTGKFRDKDGSTTDTFTITA